MFKPKTAKDLAEEKAQQESSSSDTGMVSDDAKTIIGINAVIEGNILGKENLVVNGMVKGNIEAADHHVTIGPKGRIEGEIRAHDALIGGFIQGKVNCAERVEVTRNADFYGEIQCKSISVMDGAYFKGIIELQGKPHRDKQSTDTNVEPLTSKPGKVASTEADEVAKGKKAFA